MRSRPKELFLEYNWVISILLVLVIIISGYWQMLEFFGEINSQEVRYYTFEFDDSDAKMVTKISAPQGFEENEKAVIEEVQFVDSEDVMGITGWLYIAKGEAIEEKRKLDLGNMSKKDNIYKLQNLVYKDKKPEFELEESLNIRATLMHVQNDSIFSYAPPLGERKEIEIDEPDEPQFALALLALIALCLPVFPAIKSFSDMIR